MQTLIYNATLVLPDELIENGWLLIEDEKTADFGQSSRKPYNVEREVDGRGGFLMPGLIDLHCDAIEKLAEPRPRVYIDMQVALSEADRRLAGCGITTEYHAISLDDDEFGVRSVDFIDALTQAIRDKEAKKDSLIKHEIHSRFEVTSARGFEIVQKLIANREVGLVSIMDHSPGQGQYATEEAFRKYVKRTASKTDEEIDALLILKAEQKAQVTHRIEVVTAMASKAHLPLASHDDDSAAKIDDFNSRGVTISEFPTKLEAAQRARELGEAVVMGAPNVLRGQSSGGNLSATEAIKAGITTILCSDYYPASMLPSAFKLVAEQITSLPQAVKMLTLNPAFAVGLGEKVGSLSIGKQADLLLVTLNRANLPFVSRVFVDGAERLAIS